LYVLGLAFAFSGHAALYLILGISVLVAAVGWAYTIVCSVGARFRAQSRREDSVPDRD
jgi:hypothetical protein